jgi:hypothetical protein
MNFYADTNIFGMHEITLLDYKFRKNLNDSLMMSLKKVNFDTNIEDPFHDLIELSKNNPNLFSTLWFTNYFFYIFIHFLNI